MATNQTKSRSLVLRLTILAVIVGLCGWMFLKLRSSWAPYDEAVFEATAWRSAGATQKKEKRVKMAGDLVRNHLKTGMTDKETASLLGAPDKLPNLVGFRPDNMPQVQRIYEYDMGHTWMDLAGQHHVLRLYFDAKGHFISPDVTVD